MVSYSNFQEPVQIQRNPNETQFLFSEWIFRKGMCTNCVHPSNLLPGSRKVIPDPDTNSAGLMS